MTKSLSISRRRMICATLAGAGALLTPAIVSANPRGSFGLNMTNGNTSERFRHTLIADGRWIREALTEFDWFARDWREDADYPMDGDTMVAMIKLQKMMEAGQPMVLLSGYRTPKTNSRLTGAADNSLHLRGLAADITQPGRDIRDLHRAAVSLKAGGVGYYPRQNFVHLDSGRIRHWTK